MKKLKKNQLKLDKETISSLSENDLSVVKGGVNISEDPLICYPRPSLVPQQCESMVPDYCFVTHNNNNCPLVSGKDGESCPCVSGSLRNC